MTSVRYRFGGKGAAARELVVADDLMVVGAASGQTVASVMDDAATRDAIRDAKIVARFPEAEVAVLQLQPQSADDVVARRDTSRAVMAARPEVRFAGRALVDPETREPVVYTEDIFVQFADALTTEQCRLVLAEHGLTEISQMKSAKNAFYAHGAKGLAVFDVAERLLNREDVVTCHPELLRERRFKAAGARQWHLQRVRIGDKTIDAHANVVAAWSRTRGAGTVIAVIDDGFDIDHPELVSKIVFPRDATQRTGNPRPKDPDPRWPEDHGTACAGVACASGQHGASGVAPEAKLMPIRLASGLGSRAEAEAFEWAVEHGADVISCSWGPPDGEWSDPGDPRHGRSVALPDSTRLAIEYAVREGRGGKGCVIVFAAGNGNESVDNDGYASHPDVIAVAACNDRGVRSVYSDFGAAVWCSFPSSDFEWIGRPKPLTPGIWTTDRRGRDGYNPGRVHAFEPRAPGDDAGEYTSEFGGTSSACPGVAGLAALALAANPALRWHEVKDILRDASVVIDAQRGRYDMTGHSPLYGYGRPDAVKVVALAEARGGVAPRATDASPEARLADLRRRSADVFLATRSARGARRARARSGPLSEPFSPFLPRSQAQIQWHMFAFTMAASGPQDQALTQVVDLAERRLKVSDPRLVRHALAIFVTHHPVGRKLLKPRSVREAPPLFGGRGRSIARAAGTDGPRSRSTIGNHPEVVLDVFREDALLNEHHEHWHEVYPNLGIMRTIEQIRADLGQAGLDGVIQKSSQAADASEFIDSLTGPEFRAVYRLNDRHGELFLYMHQQMIARYDAERLSVGLPRVEPLDLSAAIDVGYDPGPEVAAFPFDARPPNMSLSSGGAALLATWETAILTAIQDGIARDDGTRTPIDREMIGRIVEATDGRHSPGLATDAFGSLHNAGHGVIGELSPPDGGVMLSTVTAVRDPVFWRWHRRIDDIGYAWQQRQTGYTFADRPKITFAKTTPGQDPALTILRREDVAGDWPSIASAALRQRPVDKPVPVGTIDDGAGHSIHVVDELRTWTGQRTINGDDGAQFGTPLEVRYMTHEPFAIALRVHSNAEAATNVTFRMFMVPETLIDDRRAWIELDKFVVALSPGHNVIVREDVLSSVVKKPAEDPADLPPDHDPDALGDPTCTCGWPYSLLLPRGTPEGMRFRLAVCATDTAIDLTPEEQDCGSISLCGTRGGYPDARDMGYPFSRPFARPIGEVLATEPSFASTTLVVRHEEAQVGIIRIRMAGPPKKTTASCCGSRSSGDAPGDTDEAP